MFDLVSALANIVAVVAVTIGVAGPQALNRPANLPQNTQVQQTPRPSQNNSEMLTVSTSYSYLGQEVKAVMRFLKSGGPVTGEISGFCKGDISGNYDVSKNYMSGVAQADCPVLFLNKHVSGTFEAHIDSRNYLVIKFKGNPPDEGFKGDMGLEIK